MRAATGGLSASSLTREYARSNQASGTSALNWLASLFVKGGVAKGCAPATLALPKPVGTKASITINDREHNFVFMVSFLFPFSAHCSTQETPKTGVSCNLLRS